jgi:orotidine-5'-phosphate decarboxylase
MIDPKDRIIVALDFPSPQEARDMVHRLKGRVGVFKIGMELVYSGGLDLARELIDSGENVFLDLKLLDIGHTVLRATQAVARLGVTFLTVHGVDEKTMKAAVKGRGDSHLKLFGVTVMTNLDGEDLKQQGISSLSPSELAIRRARMAAHCGFDGIITSGHEAMAIREAIGRHKLIITPGIRPLGADVGDQSRVMTPARAIQAGADYLVIGRPITKADDPVAAVETIAAQINDDKP